MSKAPSKCPMCGEQYQWKLVDTTKKGFSVGKVPQDLQVEHQERKSNVIIVESVDLTMNIKRKIIFLLMALVLICSLSACGSSSNKCGMCNGTGYYQKKTCPTCHGSGHSSYDPYKQADDLYKKK